MDSMDRLFRRKCFFLAAFVPIINFLYVLCNFCFLKPDAKRTNTWLSLMVASSGVLLYGLLANPINWLIPYALISVYSLFLWHAGYRYGYHIIKKRKVLRVIALIVVIVLISNVAAIPGRVNKAAETVRGALSAAAQQDKTLWMEHLHPDCLMPLWHMAGLMENMGVKLTGEVEQLGLYGFNMSSSGIYSVQHVIYLQLYAVIGGELYTVRSVVVDNDRGYGITDIRIDKQ